MVFFLVRWRRPLSENNSHKLSCLRTLWWDWSTYLAKIDIVNTDLNVQSIPCWHQYNFVQGFKRLAFRESVYFFAGPLSWWYKWLTWVSDKPDKTDSRFHTFLRKQWRGKMLATHPILLSANCVKSLLKSNYITFNLLRQALKEPRCVFKLN